MPLTSVFVQTTSTCNGQCTFCPHPFTYGRHGNHSKGVMSQEVWNKIVSDLVAMNYHGGLDLYLQCEPFMDPQIGERIAQARRDVPGAFIVLSTNAGFLSDQLVKQLEKSSPHRIHIDVASGDADDYSKMTGLNLETTLANARRIIELSRGRFEVEVNCPVLPGVDVEKLQSLFPGVKVNIDYWANSRGGLVEGVSAQGRGSRFKLLSDQQCTLPRSSLNILFDGSLLVCCNDWAQLSRPYLPKVTDASLEEIANSGVLSSCFEEFSRGDYTRFPMCVLCAAEMGYATNDTTRSKVEQAREQMAGVLAHLKGAHPPHCAGAKGPDPKEPVEQLRRVLKPAIDKGLDEMRPVINTVGRLSMSAVARLRRHG